jgi:hypothetical protein
MLSSLLGRPTTYVEIAGTHHREGFAGDRQPENIAAVKTANVYIDDALAGTVDDFDGLGDHLGSTGPHDQHRADGYENATQDVS